MARLPLSDRLGNTLVAFWFLDDPALPRPDGSTPLPVSLVVAVHDHRSVMVFDRRREQWELPGGMIDPGETPALAAARELAEETGIVGARLQPAALVEFALARPPRRERAAIFRTALPRPPALVTNDEVSAFLWWDPRSPVPDDMSPLDAEIARRVLTGPAPHPQP
ncbi:ADP-ribose pyrophosphatase YjhB, NUDIX family [Streptoalloteichus tenebrarius]|uniref:ADP-ribose pyrophosphatase YjhB, NUDIX family n=1 Tax=Streptoalloteichus tenebrarius (strain ATCC 17920 / DSM 40477 / JCM 4838 / CBS 697.72 / NBRC 16177 / NCIMB 11028 / NRRL B-12390 / A12253. 1 / ISP 5477) TaxID=1933 RepID=A0ABT1HPE1_STRSD|nr:NUDIX domain-containing protein [Streptoalloteichus tenebrarius]MCP2257345.1 ADP-ribose pyrophosphatase YjhB, NUDIX family [Streptoalloteichus tenebrarius]BFF04256.1 NUDIX hydrolase [Streptoalloteichus tenebrarius]